MNVASTVPSGSPPFSPLFMSLAFLLHCSCFIPLSVDIPQFSLDPLQSKSPKRSSALAVDACTKRQQLAW